MGYMKVLVTAFACDPDAGSEAGIGFHFVRSLVEAGHHVWCLTTPKARERIESARAQMKEGQDRLQFVYFWPPLFGVRPYKNMVEMYAYYLLWQRQAADEAKRIDGEVNVDVCHHITWGSLQLGSGLWRLGKPMVFGPVGGGQFSPPGFESYFTDSRGKEVARAAMSYLLTRLHPDCIQTIRRAAKTFVSNHETAEMAHRIGGRDVTLLSDPALAQDWLAASKRTYDEVGPLKLLWVGRLFPRKGLLLTLEALALTQSDWRLTVAGDGPMAAEVDQAIETLGLGDRIVRLGQIAHEQMIDLYRSHDALIATPLRESVGVQLLEAMASGLPIITLNLHGAAVLVPNSAGLKVEVTTVEATRQHLASAVDRLSIDRWILTGMGQAAQQAAATYIWPNKIQIYVKAYEDAVRA